MTETLDIVVYIGVYTNSNDLKGSFSQMDAIDAVDTVQFRQ